jgi:solute carrier family 25 (mitochondrial adenine nucleotide translocator), member 4/5/6/31
VSQRYDINVGQCYCLYNSQCISLNPIIPQLLTHCAVCHLPSPSQTIKHDGIRGIYRGYVPSVMGIIVYRAGYFGLYDLGTKELLPYLGFTGDQQHNASMLVAKFGMALSIDIFAALCAYPLDTVRRGLMMQSGKAAAEVQYTGTVSAFKYIYNNSNGMKGLYKGALVNSIRAIGSALVLVLYDEIKYYVTKGTHEED